MQTLSGNLIEFSGFRLDAEKKILWRGPQVVSLPMKSIELLCVLVENRGEVVSKDALMELVWPDSFVEESVLTQNIYLLRKTLQKLGDGKNAITNVPRRGYLFSVEVLETNGSNIVIERHLFEKIQIEETTSGTETLNRVDAVRIPEASNYNRRISSSRILFIALAVAALSGAAIGGYFYFRGESRQIAASPAPIKLKADPSPSRKKSIAVLPMRSSDPAFSQALAHDLSVRLGALNKFTVTPFAFIREYEQNGAELNVEYVLSGDAQIENNVFRAAVSLRDTKNNVEIWVDKFEFDNLVQLQDAVTNQVAKIMLQQLSPDEREQIAKRLPTNLPAYENFLTGYMLWRKRADGSAYLKKAIELDQSFASAYAILASAKAMGGVKNSPAAVDEAETLLQKAFELDENLSDAYAVQGFVRIFHYRDWEGAEKSLKNVLELDANNVNAHHWLGVYYSIHRRLDEAKVSMQKALELDPTNPTLLADIGQLHYFAGEEGTATQYFQKALELEPNHLFANQYLALIHQPQEVHDTNALLTEVVAAADENAFALPYINVDPRYDSLRDNPSFREILRKMNLDH